MSLTGPEIVTVAVVVCLQVFAVAFVLWDQGRDLGHLYDETVALRAENEALHERVDEVVAWLWDAIGQPMPDVTPATTELPAWTPPDTSPVARARYIGQHRA